jgi:hypothetical protein
MVRKNMGAHNRISSDPAIFRYDASDGVHMRSLQKLDTPARTKERSIRQIFVILLQEEPEDFHLASISP